MQGEHALDALAVGNLAHREALVEAAAGAADAHALIRLHAGAFALDHLDVDLQGVARLEIRNALAFGEFGDLLGLELLNEVHGNSPSAARLHRAALGTSCSGLGKFLRESSGFVTLWIRAP